MLRTLTPKKSSKKPLASSICFHKLCLMKKSLPLLNSVTKEKNQIIEPVSAPAIKAYLAASVNMLEALPITKKVSVMAPGLRRLKPKAESRMLEVFSFDSKSTL